MKVTGTIITKKLKTPRRKMPSIKYVIKLVIFLLHIVSMLYSRGAQPKSFGGQKFFLHIKIKQKFTQNILSHIKVFYYLKINCATCFFILLEIF